MLSTLNKQHELIKHDCIVFPPSLIIIALLVHLKIQLNLILENYYANNHINKITSIQYKNCSSQDHIPNSFWPSRIPVHDQSDISHLKIERTMRTGYFRKPPIKTAIKVSILYTRGKAPFSHQWDDDRTRIHFHSPHINRMLR